MIQNKKILFISPFQSWPHLNGTIVRSRNLAEQLAKHNTVWYVHRTNQTDSPLKPNYLPIQTTKRRTDQLFNIFILSMLLELINKNDIDMIVVSHLWSGIYGILLGFLTGKKMVFDNHNVEALKFRRNRNIIWPVISAFERMVCRYANAIFCVSTIDRDYLVNLHKLPIQKIQVVPNGADIESLMKLPVDKINIRIQYGVLPEEKLILFFGSLSYDPNRQAVGIIFSELLPRLSSEKVLFKIIIAGQGGFEYKRGFNIQNRNLIFTGFVDDIYALIKSADVVVVPLTNGSGSRLKILESIACGTPVVSTTIGVEGIARETARELLSICDDWDAFVGEIMRYLNEPSDRQADKDFLQIYDWRNIVEGIQLPW